MSDFVANLDRFNKVADDAPGFVWRHQEADGNSTSIRIRDDDRLINNFSVWESVEALFEYAFHSDHVEMFRRRNEWFPTKRSLTRSSGGYRQAIRRRSKRRESVWRSWAQWSNRRGLYVKDALRGPGGLAGIRRHVFDPEHRLGVGRSHSVI